MQLARIALALAAAALAAAAPLRTPTVNIVKLPATESDRLDATLGRMLTINHYTNMDASATQAFLRSEDAEGLRQAVSKVAAKWLPTETRRDGLIALVKAILYAAEEAIVPKIRLWTSRNDHMSRLPVELRLHCFSFLPGAALLVASSVCVAWNELIRGTPDLWTDLDFTAPPLPAKGELAHALRLSQDRPLTVSALVRTEEELFSLDDCLLLVWHRLRGLHIDHGGYNLAAAAYDVLLTPAPELQTLTYLGHDTLPSRGSLLDGHAPKLRTVRVRNRLFRHGFASAPCSALHGVTTLTMGADGPVSPDFFMALPNLRTLDVVAAPYDASVPFCLPHLPSQHPLTSLKLKRYTLGTGGALRELGFMRVPHLVVEGYCADVIANALSAAGSTRSLSLKAEVSDMLSLSLTPDEPHATSGVFFSSDGFPSRELHKLFREPLAADLFDSLTSLALPRDFPPRSIFATDERFNSTLHSTLFPSAPLQRLRTLSILCGPRAGDSLLDAHVLQRCGVLLAPVLARLVLKRRRRDAEPVCPLELALFVTHHISIERPTLLELVVDRELGFLDSDDGGAGVEVLESHVQPMINTRYPNSTQSARFGFVQFFVGLGSGCSGFGLDSTGFVLGLGLGLEGRMTLRSTSSGQPDEKST
ncbi:hypothetical protein AURDEDRAFT_122373 [Auricularia subglabra TFB-10046 SS5]|nr:hypothetical protein AURDEDRAFT_122373 [Auricularia subglabra TFB-10046 SS5]